MNEEELKDGSSELQAKRAQAIEVSQSYLLILFQNDIPLSVKVFLELADDVKRGYSIKGLSVIHSIYESVQVAQLQSEDIQELIQNLGEAPQLNITEEKPCRKDSFESGDLDPYETSEAGVEDTSMGLGKSLTFNNQLR